MNLRNWTSPTLALALLFVAGNVSAAPEGFALGRFEPSERGSRWFVTDALDLDGHLRPSFGATFDYQYRPLAVYAADGAVQSAIVEHVLTTHVGASVVIGGRARFGATLPVVLYENGTRGTLDGAFYAPPDRSQAIGDLRLALDVRLLGDASGPFTLALGGRFWAPTGAPAAYTSDGRIRVSPRLAAAGVTGPFAYGGAIGIVFRDPRTTIFAGSPIDDEIAFSASFGIRLAQNKVLVGPELFGTTTVDDAAFKTRTTPIEAILGGHLRFGAGFDAGLGVGTGLVSGFGAPGVRALASLSWTPVFEADADDDGIPDPRDACPRERGPRSADPARSGCPVADEQDTDGDGIVDREDACMDVYGARTRDPRTNGCIDRDGDGILDPLDGCPFEAGPASNDPKTNGCPKERPVEDQDKDGVLDGVDACPDVPGIPNEDPELSGCPDPDPDKDGIPSEQDACPNEAGVADPVPSRNGCPIAFVRGTQIRIRDQVKFRSASAEILPGKESEAILVAVLEILKKHPELGKVRIEGHTDNRGDASLNKKLSEQRAAAVVRWLTGRGIEGDRLSSVGYGQERPLDSNDTEGGRALNRRVEFHLDTPEASP